MSVTMNYRKAAEDIEAAMLVLATGKISSYSIAGRSFTRHDLNTLKQMAEYFWRRHSETTYGGVTQADMSGGGR